MNIAGKHSGYEELYKVEDSDHHHIHDMDLGVGVLRYVHPEAQGPTGMQSIIYQLKSKFPRVRIGVTATGWDL